MDADDLRTIAEREEAARKPVRLRCCTAAGCASSGSHDVKQALEQTIAERGLGDTVEVTAVGCLRLCCQGPLVQSDPDGALYEKVQKEDAGPLVDAALAALPWNTSAPGASPAAAPAEPTSTPTSTPPRTPPHTVDQSHPFFTRQLPIVLENSGIVEPDRLESYIAAGGWKGLWTALREMSPAEVIAEVSKSGLRGRGGGGYPTGLKWSTVAKQPPGRKFVICNADEGDPGAFMDRSVLESDPQRVLEGMAIAAYAVGAAEGYIYVRGEYPVAIRRLEAAIKQAKKAGLLGSQIMESAFDFKIDIRIGAGAFVCGEETALIASVEGRRGTPTPRPPYPAERGLWGCPTVINNVETFANIPSILRRGADWYAGIGTAGSKGTKVFALAGRIRNSGLVEVPMGTSLREIVEVIGGGAVGGASIKAVQTGGPSGGCIPASELDAPVDYESLQALGSIMGSGGMIVMDSTTDMVDVARYFMEFSMDESCGKCIPCRAGTVQLHRLLLRIGQGQGTERDLARLEHLCEVVRSTSLCGLGQSAPNPVLSTLRFFRDEYEGRLLPGDREAR